MMKKKAQIQLENLSLIEKGTKNTVLMKH